MPCTATLHVRSKVWIVKHSNKQTLLRLKWLWKIRLAVGTSEQISKVMCVCVCVCVCDGEKERPTFTASFQQLCQPYILSPGISCLQHQLLFISCLNAEDVVLCSATDRRNLDYIGNADASFLLLALRVWVVGQRHGVGVERIEVTQCEPSFLPVLSKINADIMLNWEFSLLTPQMTWQMFLSIKLQNVRTSY